MITCTGLTFFERIKDQQLFSNSSPLIFLSLSTMYKVKKVEQNQPRKSTMAPPTQKVIKRLSKEIEEECYSNRNEHRGICLILEHDIFAPNLQLRFDSRLFRSSYIFVFWYFGHFSCVIFFPFFFPSCPSCLAKCKQRLHNIFVTKNQKRKMG